MIIPNLHFTMQALGFILAGLIFWRAESVLNLMSKECILTIRLAFWLMVVGAASIIGAIFRGYVPPAAVLVTLMGFALLLIAERRIGALLRIHKPVAHDRRAP